ncbi:MAG: hypothetical protein HYY16_00410 [Planctomycetes bacterium]|nr:hypothetical protein [Planctomycetota bacterium]
MNEGRWHELLAGGRDGVPSSKGTYLIRPAPGQGRNRLDLLFEGRSLAVLEGRWLRTVAIAFSDRELRVAAAGFAGGVTVWDTETGDVLASFPELEADPEGEGRLPLLFARADGLLICGGRRLTFIDAETWKPVRTLHQPCCALRASPDPLRIAAYESCGSGATRWLLNVKSFEIEGADRLRQTRIYRGRFGLDRAAS